MPDPSTLEYGTPGGYARTLRQKRLARMGIDGATALVAGLVGVALLAGVLGLPRLFSVFALGFAAASAYSASQHWKRAQQASHGINAEEESARALRKLGPAALLHGALLGAGGDADQVVLGPIAAVVEVKAGGGEVRVTGTSITAGRRELGTGPIKQLSRQATALTRATGTPVFLVVCLPHQRNAPQPFPGGVVCAPKDLATALSAAPRVLTPERARAIANTLWSESEARRLAKEKRS